MGTWLKLSEEIAERWTLVEDKFETITKGIIKERMDELNASLIDLNVEISNIKRNINDLTQKKNEFEVESLKVVAVREEYSRMSKRFKEVQSVKAVTK